MPIKSKAQRRKFAELLIEGKISPEVYEEWNRGAGKKELPERLHPKKDAKPKRRPRAKTKRTTKAKTARKRPARRARRVVKARTA